MQGQGQGPMSQTYDSNCILPTSIALISPHIPHPSVSWTHRSKASNVHVKTFRTDSEMRLMLSSMLVGRGCVCVCMCVGGEGRVCVMYVCMER